MAQELSDKIRAAAQEKNIDPELALRIARAESSLSSTAKAKTSSAGGLFQITDSTWKQYGGKPGKKFDADENIRVGLDIIASNQNTLRQALGRDPSNSEVYAAHYFGPQGAKSFLSAAPDTPIESILGKAAIKANPNLKGKTASQVLASLETKVGSKPAVSRETPAAPTQTEAERVMEPALRSGMTAQAPAAPGAQQLASLGPSYQAALALSVLSDSDDEKEKDIDNEPSIAEQFLAEQSSRPTALAQLNEIRIRSPFSEAQQPVMMNKGGDVGEAEEARMEEDARPTIPAREALNLFKFGNRMQQGGADMQAMGFGASAPVGEGSASVMANISKMTRDEKENMARAMLASLRYPVGEGQVMANLIKPQGPGTEGVYMADVGGSYPVGEGRLGVARQMLRTPNFSGPTGYAINYGGKVGPGYLSAGFVLPDQGRPQGQIQYQLPVGRADGSPQTGETVDSVVRVARQNDSYPAIERYLTSRDAMPTVKISALPDGTIGMFTADNTQIGKGVLKIDSSSPLAIRPGVLTHEMTHAADRQMKQQFLEQRGFFGNKRNQFTEAYEKLVGPEGVNRTEMARRRNPDWASENRLYRSSPKEISAHGVGAFSGPNIQDRAPRHVDATAASDFAVLLDLAQRNVDNGPKGLEKIPAFFKRMTSYAEGGEARKSLQDFVLRSKGSPEQGEVAEPTAEELERASKPAFVTPKSGIGRKISTKPGEIEGAVLQGVSETPYNVVGFPADVGAMLMRPFGYDVKAPMGGSEWLKQKASAAGIRQAPPESPTARAFYELGQIGGSSVSPAAPVRRVAQAVEGAKESGKAAQMLESMKNIPVGASIKPIEPIFQHTPTAEAPFVGRLDEFVSGLQSPVRKDQFLGQLKGKFRDYDITRAEKALKDLSPDAKLSPSDLLNRIKMQYDPASIRTTVREPRETGFWRDQDNPYLADDKPVGVIHMSTYVSPEQAARFAALDKVDSQLFRAGDVSYTSTARVPELDFLRTNPIGNTQVERLEEFRQYLIDHSAPLFDAKRLMNEYMYPATTSRYKELMTTQGLGPWEEALATARRNGVPENQQAIYANEAVMDTIRQPAMQKMEQMLGVVPRNESQLVEAVRAKQGALWDDQRKSLAQDIARMTQDMRRYFFNNAQKYGLEKPYRGKDIHYGLEPPENAAGFTRFVEQTTQDPQRGPLKGIHLLEIQSDLTSELKAGEKAGLKSKEVFPNMAENRRLVQQLGMKNAIAAAINRGDQFVTFPGKESKKPHLYEGVRDNLKAVAKDFGPGFEIRPFTFTSPEKGEIQHWGITWDPDAAARIQKKGVPFKDGGAVERNTADNRKYL